MSFRNRVSFAFLALLLILVGGLFFYPRDFVFYGTVFGTRYHGVIEHVSYARYAVFQYRLAELFRQFNHELSTYDPESVISRFNGLSADESLDVAAYRYLSDVVRLSQRLYLMTDGAFDPTVLPLIELWGFRGDTPFWRPSDSDISATLARVGFDGVSLEGSLLSKRRTGMMVDFSANAKGFGVDQVALLAESMGIRHYLIEIGGEVRVSAQKYSKDPWIVGVELPTLPTDSESADPVVYARVPMQGGAIATSGYYRNYFEQDGVMYMHIVDPRTGYPVQGEIVSVSVLAPDCGLADGLATALFVLGVEKGLALVESLDGVECLILVRGVAGDVSGDKSGDKVSNGLSSEDVSTRNLIPNAIRDSITEVRSSGFWVLLD